MAKEALRTRPKLFRIAIVLFQPLLEDFVNRDAFPRGRMIRVDWIEAAQTKDRLGIEGEWICLQPVDRSDRDPVRTLRRWWRRCRTIDRVRQAWIVQNPCEAFQPDVAWKPAGHGIEPKQEAGRHGRRPAFAATPINQSRPLDPRGRVEIENMKGTIEVRAWDRAEVKI